MISPTPTHYKNQEEPVPPKTDMDSNVAMRILHEIYMGGQGHSKPTATSVSIFTFHPQHFLENGL